jgi:diguanylate cyclase (GGDEF)-like protein
VTAPSVSAAHAQEAPHTAGVTTALTLAHVERHGGRAAVEAVLEQIGKAGREAELRDERTWWSWETKIALFEAASEVLGDPEVTRNAGMGAIEANVARPLQAGLRALGSPRVVYANVVRANHKFSHSSRMVLEELSDHRAVVRYELVVDVEPQRLDCLYNQGLLACVPLLFDLPAARVAHPACAVHGAAHCVYEVSWSTVERPAWHAALAAGGAAAALAAGSAALAPEAWPVVAALPAGAAAWWSSRRTHALGRAAGDAERRVQVAAERHEQVRASLHALASALDQDSVGAEICEHASTALGGQETALLLDDGTGALRAHPNSLAGPEACAALERWGTAAVSNEAVELSDVREVDALAHLADLPAPVASLSAAPLRARGEDLGVLVVLAPRSDSFLPEDLAILALFAEQASIALSNAKLYAAQQEMATRDPLTGLRNHREFQDAVEAELARSRRTGAPFSAALLDLDGFKAVNDRFGHAAGDRLLVELGGALEAAARGSDAVFRVGGDEFAVLLAESGAADARAAMARIVAAAAGVDERIGVSWGLATWPADASEKGPLLALADARLYAMKRGRAGRRRTRPRMHRRRGAPVRSR